MSAIPKDLLQSLSKFSFYNEEKFLKAQEKKPLTSIRLNPSKNYSSFDFSKSVSWCSSGFYLSNANQFGADPHWHAGTYYVQEASSMILEQFFKQIELPLNKRILDLCAAPGGKSTLISNFLHQDDLLISNEIHPARATVLKENIVRWGNTNNWVCSNSSKEFQNLNSFFDVILVDAPCSGSGLFRKDKHAIEEWSNENVTMCAARQQNILQDIIPALKPNGYLIYSTCSYSKEENETILDHLLEKYSLESIPLQMDEKWQIQTTFSDKHQGVGYRFSPEFLDGEGFYFTIFKNINKQEPNKKWNNKTTVPTITLKELKDYLSLENKTLINSNEKTIALQTALIPDYFFLEKKLKWLKRGIFLGEQIRDQFIPHHELAMSNQCSYKNKIEVDLQNAIRYLQKEPIALESKPKGWYLITYENAVLGWVKHLGNRINNYYPASIRIYDKKILL